MSAKVVDLWNSATMISMVGFATSRLQNPPDTGAYMKCRIGCAACCIAPSISSAIPGMQNGKPAGERCIQLTDDNSCRIFGSTLRPPVCGSLQPNIEMCGNSTNEAMERLAQWEHATRPE